MFQINRISTAIPLSIYHLDSENHLKACCNSFDLNTNPTGDTSEEGEALDLLHCDSSDSPYGEQIKWLYCLHSDKVLADFAFSFLPSDHSETASFELLKPSFKKSFLSLLRDRLGTEDDNVADLLSLAESIGNRALGCDEPNVVRLAAHLLSLIDKEFRRALYLPLEQESSRVKRAQHLTEYPGKWGQQAIRSSFLYQMFICENEGLAIKAEQALARQYERSGEIPYHKETVQDICSMLERLFAYRPKRTDIEYNIIYKWKAALMCGYISGFPWVAPVEAEDVILRAMTEMKPVIKYIDTRLFDYQSDDLCEGRVIEPVTEYHSLTMAKIHANFYPMSLDHIDFYLHYPDEDLGERMLLFISELGNGHVDSELQKSLDRIYIKLIENFPPKIRISMAKTPHICNRYFDKFLQPGLPPCSTDAIKHVDWEAFKKQNVKETITKAKEYLTKVAKYSSWVSEWVNARFDL